VRPARLERATYGSGGRRSIQLSYGRGVVDYNGNELGAQLGDDAKAQCAAALVAAASGPSAFEYLLVPTRPKRVATGFGLHFQRVRLKMLARQPARLR
jgi:hypothetical protein